MGQPTVERMPTSRASVPVAPAKLSIRMDRGQPGLELPALPDLRPRRSRTGHPRANRSTNTVSPDGLGRGDHLQAQRGRQGRDTWAAGGHPALQQIKGTLVTDQTQPHRPATSAPPGHGWPHYQHIGLFARPQAVGRADHHLRRAGQRPPAQPSQLLDVIRTRILGGVAAAATAAYHHPGTTVTGLPRRCRRPRPRTARWAGLLSGQRQHCHCCSPSRDPTIRGVHERATTGGHVINGPSVGARPSHEARDRHTHHAHAPTAGLRTRGHAPVELTGAPTGRRFPGAEASSASDGGRSHSPLRGSPGFSLTTPAPQVSRAKRTAGEQEHTCGGYDARRPQPRGDSSPSSALTLIAIKLQMHQDGISGARCCLAVTQLRSEPVDARDGETERPDTR